MLYRSNPFLPILNTVKYYAWMCDDSMRAQKSDRQETRPIRINFVAIFDGGYCLKMTRIHSALNLVFVFIYTIVL